MNLTYGFIASVVALGLYFNLYKFDIMMSCYNYGYSYWIFPWSEYPEISSSHPVWLIAHLVTSLFHMCLAGFIVIYPDVKNTLATVLSISHCAFLLLIIMNVTHLGEAGTLTAMTINWLGIVLTSMTYHSDWKYKDLIYFIIITMPVFIEVFRYMRK